MITRFFCLFLTLLTYNLQSSATEIGSVETEITEFFKSFDLEIPVACFDVYQFVVIDGGRDGLYRTIFQPEIAVDVVKVKDSDFVISRNPDMNPDIVMSDYHEISEWYGTPKAIFKTYDCLFILNQPTDFLQYIRSLKYYAALLKDKGVLAFQSKIYDSEESLYQDNQPSFEARTLQEGFAIHLHTINAVLSQLRFENMRWNVKHEHPYSNAVGTHRVSLLLYARKTRKR